MLLIENFGQTVSTLASSPVAGTLCQLGSKYASLHKGVKPYIETGETAKSLMDSTFSWYQAKNLSEIAEPAVTIALTVAGIALTLIDAEAAFIYEKSIDLTFSTYELYTALTAEKIDPTKCLLRFTKCLGLALQLATVTYAGPELIVAGMLCRILGEILITYKDADKDALNAIGHLGLALIYGYQLSQADPFTEVLERFNIDFSSVYNSFAHFVEEGV